MKKRAIIIGAGVGGLATACILGQAGYEVTIYEKNSTPGGRAGTFTAKGFRFDTGPSWYLMPDIIAQFFELLGEDVDQKLELKRLQPSYRVFYKDRLFGAVDIVGDIARDGDTLESLEPGARTILTEYLEKSALQYSLAKERFLYKNTDSMKDFLAPSLLLQAMKLNIFTTMQNYVARYFSSAEVQKIMQYPMLFLGVNPKSAPALYNILNHVDFNQGVHYPMGGMYKLVEVLGELAEARGVKIVYDSPAIKIKAEGGTVKAVELSNGELAEADIVISNADLHHTETALLDPEHRTYPQKYWNKSVMAPSILMIYLGVKASYPRLKHHNLVFSRDWSSNFKAIFDTKSWPKDPSFYVCNTNKTDLSSAPKKHENLTVLVPIPAMTQYSPDDEESYAYQILETMENTMHLDGLRKKVIYKKTFCARDYEQSFNSYRGSALGLAHTLRQSAAMRPANYSKKVSGLYYVGANTMPGIGLPMCLISAQLVYKRLTGNVDSSPLKFI